MRILSVYYLCLRLASELVYHEQALLLPLPRLHHRGRVRGRSSVLRHPHSDVQCELPVNILLFVYFVREVNNLKLVNISLSYQQYTIIRVLVISCLSPKIPSV